MRRIFLLLVLSVATSITLFADHVNRNTARKVAKNFLYEKGSFVWDCSFGDLLVNDEFVLKDGETSLIYVFNFSDKGFVLVSADDATHPVPAYSLKESFTGEKIPPQLNSLLKHYKDQILEAISGKVTSTPQIKSEWERLKAEDPKKLNPSKLENTVGPFLTSTWDQSPYYNGLCPDGEIGQAHTGCVATALGQILYYFRYPETGTGSYTYSCENYGELSADFGAATYKYEEMVDALNDPNDAVAEMLFHLGVSVDMDYGPDGSGMWNHSAANSLKNYFKYDPNTQYVFRDSTSMDWDSLLYDHLDRNIPMYYAGWHETDTSYGHAFICDGYQDDYFHFDWGWGGSYNGYFMNDDLYPGGSEFNYHQELIINAIPDLDAYEYPQYCSGENNLTYHEGSISDGSGPFDDYEVNSTCSWLISPQNEQDSVSYINLHFSRFDLADDDAVYVYDGNSTDADLLGMFSGSEMPDAFESTSNEVLVVFESNDVSVAGGFLLIYEAENPLWCGNMTTITSSFEYLTDGSGAFDYYNNTMCKWFIRPDDYGTIYLDFEKFETKEGDKLSIYDLGSSELLAEIEGYYSPEALPEPVHCVNDVMILWSSNDTERSDGWEIDYSLITDIKKKNLIDVVQVFPNPANDHLYVGNIQKELIEVTISVADVQGRILVKRDLPILRIGELIDLDCSNWNPGIYFVSVLSEQVKTIQKIVIE